MLEKIRKWDPKYREIFIIAFPAAIVLVYLYCGTFGTFTMDEIKENLKALIFDILPEVINSLIILLSYWAWRCYKKENVPAILCILLAGIAVTLPFVEGIRQPQDWIDLAEKLFGFALILWPVLITCLSDWGVGKLVKNKKIVFGINVTIVFILAAGLHLFAGGVMEEKWSRDLAVPAVWLAESLLWSMALYLSDKGKSRKRNVVLAWLVCLAIFFCTTFMEAFYLSSTHIWGFVRGRYWNKVLFLCWPVFLAVLIRALRSRISPNEPYFVQKMSISYFCIVMLLSYLLTDVSPNFGTGAFRDDICCLAYMLMLAEFVIWKEVYGNQGHKGSRVKALLLLLLVNIGAFVFLLVRNERLREVLYYMGFSFMGNGLSIPQADWTGYRKAAVHAFFTNDLTVLDNAYRNEGYYSVLNYSRSLAIIRFHIGILPVLAMILLLVLAVGVLWNWNRDSEVFHKCARYLAAGYLLKMSMSVILQMNMVLSPYCEFPFTGRDMPELVVLILLIHEGRRKLREERGNIHGFCSKNV